MSKHPIAAKRVLAVVTTCAVAAFMVAPLHLLANADQQQPSANGEVLPDLSGYEMPQPYPKRQTRSQQRGLEEYSLDTGSGTMTYGFPGQFAPDRIDGVTPRSSTASTLIGADQVGETAEIIDPMKDGPGNTMTVQNIAVGTRCNVYAATGLMHFDGAQDHAQEIADEFDNDVYDTVTGLVGEPVGLPNNTGKINIVLYDIEGKEQNNPAPGHSYIGGFFDAQDFAGGNHDAIIYLDFADSYGHDVLESDGITGYMGVVAHEFQHLVCHSRIRTKSLAMDSDDPEQAYGTYISNWLNEGASCLADVLYQGRLETSHLEAFLSNDFPDGNGYVPNSIQWDDAAVSDDRIVANYGAATLLMAEYYAARPGSLEPIVSSPKVGYNNSRRLIGDGYTGESNPDYVNFDRFFRDASLNIQVDSPSAPGDKANYYTDAIKNTWERRDDLGVEPLTIGTSLNVSSEGRDYFNNLYLADGTAGTGSPYVEISLPDNSAGEYYIITPYNETGVDSRDEWNAAPKMAALLKPGNNVVTVGTDNYFGLLAVNYDSAMDDVVSYQLAETGSLIRVEPISGVAVAPNGVEKTAAALGLSATANLVTDRRTVPGPIQWDVDGTSYDPSSREEQQFTVEGVVTLPDGVENPQNIPLNVETSVTVLAAGEDAGTPGSPTDTPNGGSNPWGWGSGGQSGPTAGLPGGGSSGGSSGGGGGSSFGGSSSGSSERDTVPRTAASVSAASPAASVSWISGDTLKSQLAQAKQNGGGSVRTTGKAVMGVKQADLALLKGVAYVHDTLDANNKFQVRVQIAQPELVTKDLLVSGFVSSDYITRMNERLAKWFTNPARIIQMSQKEEWGQTVRVTAAVDLGGMDAKNLRFYSYNPSTNHMKPIANPQYTVDNGLISFDLPGGGDVIISQGDLQAR